MQEASVITRYAESIASELRFDPWLSRCVQQEVEDHLQEAVADSSAADVSDAARRAVANFGDPHVIAAQFATVSLSRQTRRLAAYAVSVIGAVFVAMTARLQWYAVIELEIERDFLPAAQLVGRIDSWAFWLSICVGAVGWAYVATGRVPAQLDSDYLRMLRRFFVVCGIAAAALMVSVIGDGVLTAFRLLRAEPSAGFAVPILLMLLEIGIAGAVGTHIVRTVQRVRLTATMFELR